MPKKVIIICLSVITITIVVGVMINLAPAFTSSLLPSPFNQESAPIITQRCIATGCSGQLCVDLNQHPDGLITTCEWRPAYDCYQQATCELQPDQTCGFTMTPALQQCLDDTANEPNPLMTIPFTPEGLF